MALSYYAGTTGFAADADRVGWLDTNALALVLADALLAWDSVSGGSPSAGGIVTTWRSGLGHVVEVSRDRDGTRVRANRPGAGLLDRRGCIRAA